MVPFFTPETVVCQFLTYGVVLRFSLHRGICSCFRVYFIVYYLFILLILIALKRAEANHSTLFGHHILQRARSNTADAGAVRRVHSAQKSRMALARPSKSERLERSVCRFWRLGFWFVDCALRTPRVLDTLHSEWPVRAAARRVWRMCSRERHDVLRTARPLGRATRDARRLVDAAAPLRRLAAAVRPVRVRLFAVSGGCAPSQRFREEEREALAFRTGGATRLLFRFGALSSAQRISCRCCRVLSYSNRLLSICIYLINC